MTSSGKELDRFVRKIASHPISKAIAGFLQQEKIIEHYGETPIIKILDGYVADFHYLNSDPPHYRRFVILRIMNDGPKAATGCWASISIDSLHLKEVPLHWADAPYTILRNSMETITIPPTITRELDIAFSVYRDYPPNHAVVRNSGNSISTTSWVSPSISPTKGTYDPRIISTGSDGGVLHTANQDFHLPSTEKLEGAWIASHLVIAYPREKNEHYLPPNDPPRRYNARVRFTCNEGQTAEIDMVLIIPPIQAD